MIYNFRHKGLKLFFEKDDSSKLNAIHIEKIRLILYQLDEAESIQDMDKAGWQLHCLSGNYKGFWSVKINGNWRIIFRFINGWAVDVNYLDYH